MYNVVFSCDVKPGTVSRIFGRKAKALAAKNKKEEKPEQADEAMEHA